MIINNHDYKLLTTTTTTTTTTMYYHYKNAAIKFTKFHKYKFVNF